eukprot:scaffold213283_cov17-Prasinocladus_malaysianus.AAC.1
MLPAFAIYPTIALLHGFLAPNNTSPQRVTKCLEADQNSKGRVPISDFQIKRVLWNHFIYICGQSSMPGRVYILND